MAHPDFGRSVNLISTRPGETDYAHLITTGTPGFSDLLTALYCDSFLTNFCDEYKAFWQIFVMNFFGIFFFLLFDHFTFASFKIDAPFLNLILARNKNNISVCKR